MPVRVIYDPDCDQDVMNYHTAFQQWINNNPRHHNILFDEALVLSVPKLHEITKTQR